MSIYHLRLLLLLTAVTFTSGCRDWFEQEKSGDWFMIECHAGGNKDMCGSKVPPIPSYMLMGCRGLDSDCKKIYLMGVAVVTAKTPAMGSVNLTCSANQEMPPGEWRLQVYGKTYQRKITIPGDENHQCGIVTSTIGEAIDVCNFVAKSTQRNPKKQHDCTRKCQTDKDVFCTINKAEVGTSVP